MLANGMMVSIQLRQGTIPLGSVQLPFALLAYICRLVLVDFAGQLFVSRVLVCRLFACRLLLVSRQQKSLYITGESTKGI